MDLQTENRIATILMKQAAELRRQAEQESVLAYLKRQPTVRGRPNSRFLTATVLGVQQANKAVEVNELWRVRQKELELDDRLSGSSRHERNSSRKDIDNAYSSGGTSKRQVLNDNNATDSSRKRLFENYDSRDDDDEGLKDEEIEEFLHSRAKRGRGAVSSRMDKTGPYLPSCSDVQEKFCLDVRQQRRAFGPEKPPPLEACESSSEEEETDGEDSRKHKKHHRSRSSTKKHSKRHRQREKSRDKKTKRKEKRSRHS